MKNEIRKEMKEKRSKMSTGEVTEKSRHAAKIFLESELYKNAKSLMLYMPLGNEISTLEIISDAFKQGKDIIVPITDRETFDITACRITQNTEFEKGVFSLTEPKEMSPFDKSKIDVVLVPGVAFDRSGGRIGFGKGCYDKFLKGIKAVKIGFCYDFQVVEHIKTDETDINMDFIITEKEIIRGKL